MHFISRAVADAFCCFTFHSHDDLQRPAKLQKMPAATHSPTTMSTPCTTLPTAYESPDALQNLFASNSSTRGYHAARSIPPKHAAIQGSLDLNFRFGSESPKKKTSGRLEQLTNHVRHQLSGSHLSKSHAKSDMTTVNEREGLAIAPIPSVSPVPEPLSRSQGSIGLTELLASRNVSEGGYDSDARSIHSPLTLSTAGTLTIGPRFMRKSLATIEGSQNDEQPSRAGLVETPTNDVVHSIPKVILSTSPSPTTQKKTPFLDACQVGAGESPKDVLRRLSAGIAKGTIEMPRTPELRATQIDDIDESESEWRLSLSAPRRASSLGKREDQLYRLFRHNPDMDPSTKRLADYVSEVKRASHHSSTQNSLISGLDPALIGYIGRFTNDKLCPESVSSSPVTAVQVRSEPTSETARNASRTAITDPLTSKSSNHDVTSATTSETRSVHLFDMRISHRLASTSRIPITSSTFDTSNDSSGSLGILTSKDMKYNSMPPSDGRMPSFIAFEHTRRPSDPQTKKLFEQVSNSNGAIRLGMRSFSGGNFVGKQNDQLSRHAVVDDSSSYYGSTADGPSNSQDMSRTSTRSNSMKNVHSLAIGGRSASGPLLGRGGDKSIGNFLDGAGTRWSRKNSLGQSCKSEEIWETPQEAAPVKRTLNVRKQSKYLKVDSTPTPVARKFYDSTEANEDMSEIGIERALKQDDLDLADLDSEAREQLRNETFSDIDRTYSSLDVVAETGDVQTAEGWLSQGRRQGWNYGFKDDTPIRKQNLSNTETENTERSRQEDVEDSASNIWHRAFKRIGEPGDHGRLLATPKFDTEGRRKSLTKTSSETSQAYRISQYLSASPIHRRSQSADVDRSHIFASDRSLETYRRKSVPILSVSGDKSLKPEKQLRVGKSKMKRSLGDISRLVTKSTILDNGGKSQSLKSPFSIWGRFPSHTRDQRNGPAGSEDDVKIRDFCRGGTESLSAQSTSMRIGDSTPSTIATPRKAWRAFTLKESGLRKGSTKSMTFAHVTAELAKRRKKGLAGKIRRLYRTRSSQFHAYATKKGHRSSVSVSSHPEFPELECLPGEGALSVRRVEDGASELDMDGISERQASSSLETISETRSRKSRSMLHLTMPRSKRDAEEWSRLYQECVGSLSALKSENNLDGSGVTGERRVLSFSSVLRDSTVDFHAKLSQDADRAKEELLNQLQKSRESESEGLRMPGSFV